MAEKAESSEIRTGRTAQTNHCRVAMDCAECCPPCTVDIDTNESDGRGAFCSAAKVSFAWIVDIWQSVADCPARTPPQVINDLLQFPGVCTNIYGNLHATEFLLQHDAIERLQYFEHRDAARAFAVFLRDHVDNTRARGREHLRRALAAQVDALTPPREEREGHTAPPPLPPSHSERQSTSAVAVRQPERKPVQLVPLRSPPFHPAHIEHINRTERIERMLKKQRDAAKTRRDEMQRAKRKADECARIKAQAAWVAKQRAAAATKRREKNEGKRRAKIEAMRKEQEEDDVLRLAQQKANLERYNRAAAATAAAKAAAAAQMAAAQVATRATSAMATAAACLVENVRGKPETVNTDDIKQITPGARTTLIRSGETLSPTALRYPCGIVLVKIVSPLFPHHVIAVSARGDRVMRIDTKGTPAASESTEATEATPTEATEATAVSKATQVEAAGDTEATALPIVLALRFMLTSHPMASIRCVSLYDTDACESENVLCDTITFDGGQYRISPPCATATIEQMLQASHAESVFLLVMLNESSKSTKAYTLFVARLSLEFVSQFLQLYVQQRVKQKIGRNPTFTVEYQGVFPTPVERVVDALNRHLARIMKTTIATIATGKKRKKKKCRK